MKYIFVIVLFFFNSSHSFEYEKLKTKSGIEFWFVEDKSIPIVSVSFSFKGGSSIDFSEKNGISNLMTSLMDEGTSKLTSIDFKNQMKLNGMRLNFSSQKDKIDGSFQIIASQLEQGFELFYQALNHPRFDEDDIERVRKQIISSIKLDESDLSTLASNKFNQFFFNEHNFSRNVKGSINTISNIDRNDLINFHKKAFQKNNIIIGVAGNIKKKKITDLIEKVFGNLENSEKIPPVKKFTRLAKGEETYNMKTPQTSVLFGHPGLARNSDDFFALRIANYIFGGGGFQSRLYKNVREKKGLVYSIYSYLLSYDNDGVIVGGFQTRNKSVYQTIKNVKNELKRLQSNGISRKEFENAKAYFKGSFTRNFTSTISIARLLQIVQYYDLGEDYFEKRDEIINNLELKKVNEIISKFYSSEELFFMIVGEPEG